MSVQSNVDIEQQALVESRLHELLSLNESNKMTDKEFWGKQFDLGLAWVHFPIGMGGLGLTPALNEFISFSLRHAGVPSNFLNNPIGIGMGAPTLITHAPEMLSERLLRPMFTCEEIWCQLFSEPGAGSDVASLTTRAIRDGDEWIINGQKVWTTLAHVAKWGMLLARTNSSAPKHSGMTYFIVDIKSPGVDVRPIRQITGEAEFNEVYFTDVRIADSQRLGEVGEGWRVAITTLMNERVSLGGLSTDRGSGTIGDAVNLWKEFAQRPPYQLDRLAKLWAAAEVIRLTNIRASQLRMAGTPGPEGSVAKLASAELNKEIYNFCEDLKGADGMLYSTYEMSQPSSVKIANPEGKIDATKMFLRSRANSIEGGTSEIMRNILGERVLGLPGEPKFNEIPSTRSKD